MRAIGLALIALALAASPASAAVIEIRDNYCGCDGSSGDSDTRTLIVRAGSGEENRVSVRTTPRGIVVTDAGAALTGACRPARSRGRFCRGPFEGGEIYLGDGDDTLDADQLGVTVGAGPGDDRVLVDRGFHVLNGGPGADRLEAAAGATALVSYTGHAEAVTVRLNGVADDGAAGEGDLLLGAITAIQGGAGDDRLEAGPKTESITGEEGNDTLVGGPRAEVLRGDVGNDELSGGDGDDNLLGGEGADVLGGGPGRDEAGYWDHRRSVRASIGDGANDGESLEGDDIRADVENIAGGPRADVITGDERANSLSGGGGADEIFGLGGDDELSSTGGSLLDAGSGRDILVAANRDRLRLDDGEPDKVVCHSHAPEVSADELDAFLDCAPSVWVRELRARRQGTLRLRLSCELGSAVPCRGRIALGTARRPLARPIRFGALAPGQRRVVTLRLLGPLARGCVNAVVTSRRTDIRTVTERRFPVHCRLG